MFHSHHLYRGALIALLFCACVWPWSGPVLAAVKGQTSTKIAAADAKQIDVSARAEATREDEARKIAAEDLQAQKDQANYAFYLVAIGAFTAVFLIYQLILLRRQVEGARAEFNATHRPKLVVRQVSLKRGQRGAVLDQIGAEFVVANIGATPAKITEVNVRLWVTEPNENLPAVPPYGESRFPALQIVAGETTSFEHHEGPDVSNEAHVRNGYLSVAMNRSGGHARSGMLILGYVIYEDGNCVKRRTAFLREYRYDLMRFEPIVHPDYEYQD